MVVLRRIAYNKGDRNFAVKGIDLAVSEIGTDVERQTVNSVNQSSTIGDQVAGSAVGIGRLIAERFPVSIACLTLERYGDAGRRPPDRNIENVCCYTAHNDNSFLNRILVISCCSPAAILISVLLSLFRRSRQSSSISDGLFPVAQTM